MKKIIFLMVLASLFAIFSPIKSENYKKINGYIDKLLIDSLIDFDKHNGGEEFLIIMVKTDYVDSNNILERIDNYPEIYDIETDFIIDNDISYIISIFQNSISIRMITFNKLFDSIKVNKDFFNIKESKTLGITLEESFDDFAPLFSNHFTLIYLNPKIIENYYYFTDIEGKSNIFQDSEKNYARSQNAKIWIEKLSKLTPKFKNYKPYERFKLQKLNK